MTPLEAVALLADHAPNRAPGTKAFEAIGLLYDICADVQTLLDKVDEDFPSGLHDVLENLRYEFDWKPPTQPHLPAWAEG